MCKAAAGQKIRVAYTATAGRKLITNTNNVLFKVNFTTPVVFLLIIHLSSCHTKNGNSDTDHSKDSEQYYYRLTIDVRKDSGHESVFVLNNGFGTDDRPGKDSFCWKLFTLYRFGFHPRENPGFETIRILVPEDTLQIAFSEQSSDTMLELAKEYLSAVEFNDYDKTGQRMFFVNNDYSGSVELHYPDKQQLVSIKGVESASAGKKELDTLLHYVSRFCVAT